MRRRPTAGVCWPSRTASRRPPPLTTAPDGARRLETGPHVTARGARIPPKLWLVAFEGPRWRVLRKLPGAGLRG
jgi:hypothetical protein